jgi:hypothetical protein
MIYFLQEDAYTFRIWQYQNYDGDGYKIISVEQMVQIQMACQLLGIEMVELHYVDPSLV